MCPVLNTLRLEFQFAIFHKILIKDRLRQLRRKKEAITPKKWLGHKTVKFMIRLKISTANPKSYMKI